MALQKDYTIDLNYVLTTDVNADDVEKSIQKQYTVENAYFKVINISPIVLPSSTETAETAENEENAENTEPVENTSSIYLEVYNKDKTQKVTVIEVKGFKPSNVDGAENIIKQAYKYLKTTETFAEASNVLEEGQSA